MAKNSLRKMEILEYIKRFTNTEGYPPTIREIGNGVGLSSTSSVCHYVKQLEADKLLTKENTKPRTLKAI